MKTVADLCNEAVSLQRQGRDPSWTADYLVASGPANGFPSVGKIVSGVGAKPSTIALEFGPGGDVIYFDGKDWQYRPRLL